MESFLQPYKAINVQLAIFLLPFIFGMQICGAGNVILVQAIPNSDTIHVAPPAGDSERDRENILAALEKANPGSTIQFASGTYVTGGSRIYVTTPGVILVGDADGTVIRGCEQATLDTLDVATMRQGQCAGLFALQGGHQSVRSLTLEGVHTALDLGWFAGEVDAPARDGGYNVEKVTFRNVSKGVNVMGQWTEVATIRDNRFLNVYHAISLQGGTSHVLENYISAPEPGSVFYQGFPGGAIGAIAAPECGRNVIAGNRIQGHPDGITVGTLFPGTSCRNNIIRNNIIEVSRVTFNPNSPGRSMIVVEHEDNYTVAGVPISIINGATEIEVPAGAPPEWQGPAFSENHIIEDNHILGAAGIGIQIRRSSGNRIANNIIETIVPREPFPGNHLYLHPGLWKGANGSGIWLSAGSNENEITGNTFEDVASAAVFLEGDRNRVELREENDLIKDLGAGNKVSAGQDPGSDLWETVKELDSLYFESYNNCDMEVFADWHSDDLEVIHTAVEGITGKEEFLKLIETKLCSGDVEKRRDLIPGTLEVYELINTGALEIVTNRYFMKMPDGKEITAEGRMILVWQKTGEVWKISRIYSL